MISFTSVDNKFILRRKRIFFSWILLIFKTEKINPKEIFFTFANDSFLLKLNKKYLAHNYYTDIITFNLSEDIMVCGDVYISIDRVKENARLLKIPFYKELSRVIAHGVLHLCGYNDKTESEIIIMRKKEDHYLSLLNI